MKINDNLTTSTNSLEENKNDDNIKTYIPINTKLREIGIRNISITRDYFNITFNNNFEIYINRYINYEDIFERTQSQLLDNSFASSDAINKILEYLESNYQAITNKIEEFSGGGFS